MALRYVIISALFVLHTACHQCKWTNMRMIYGEIFEALSGTGTDVPTECLITNDRSLQVNFRLSKKVFGGPLQEGDAMKTVHETFLQMLNISQKNLEAASWDEAQIDRLNMNIYRLTSDLYQCMQPLKQNKRSTNHLKVKKHFEKMKGYLKDMHYSQCAWETVKSELKTLLRQVRSLMIKL